MLTILLVGGKTAGERKPLLRGFSEGHLGRPCPGVCVGRHAVRSSAVMDQCGSASGKHDVLGILGILVRQRKRVFAFELWLHEVPHGATWCHMVPHGASNWGNWGRDKNFNGAKVSQVLDTYWIPVMRQTG